jgi:hypothetical protein
VGRAPGNRCLYPEKLGGECTVCDATLVLIFTGNQPMHRLTPLHRKWVFRYQKEIIPRFEATIEG